MADGGELARDALEFCLALPTPADMIDYSGHLNVGFYGVLFEEAARGWFPRLDLSREYRERTDHALFAAELHIVFLAEVAEGDRLAFYAQVLEAGERGLHCVYHMWNESKSRWAARQEILYLHVDLARRKVAPFPKAQHERLAAIADAHSILPRLEVGRQMRLRKPG